MTLFFAVERATLLIPSGTEQDPNRKHLFILMNTPVTNEKLVLLLSLSSLKANRPHDATCIIQPEEVGHSFVTKPSFIEYSKAMIEPVAKLERGVKQGLLIPQGTIEREVFQRILAGVMLSNRVPHKCKQFVKEYLIQ